MTGSSCFGRAITPPYHWYFDTGWTWYRGDRCNALRVREPVARPNIPGYAAALLADDWPTTAYRLSVANGDVAYFARHATIAPRRTGREVRS